MAACASHLSVESGKRDEGLQANVRQPREAEQARQGVERQQEKKIDRQNRAACLTLCIQPFKCTALFKALLERNCNGFFATHHHHRGTREILRAVYNGQHYSRASTKNFDVQAGERNLRSARTVVERVGAVPARSIVKRELFRETV